MKRIIKQNKLKPVEAYKNDNQNITRNGRNKHNLIENVSPIISKTYEANYNEEKEANNPIVNQKAAPIQLATLEWKSKANNKSLHESMVDLRKEASEEFYKNDDILNDYGNDIHRETKSNSKSKYYKITLFKIS